VKVTVPSVQILVRRCGSGNAFSNTCTIAAGGCDSAEQKADVRIQLTPAIAGIPVNIPQITGGQGVRVGSASNDAKIVLDDSYMSYMEDDTDGQYVTDAFGRVEGTYWGSNLVDNNGDFQVPVEHKVTLSIPVEAWTDPDSTDPDNDPDDADPDDPDPDYPGPDDPSIPSVTIYQEPVDIGDTNRWNGMDDVFDYESPAAILYHPTFGELKEAPNPDGLKNYFPICEHQIGFQLGAVTVTEKSYDQKTSAVDWHTVIYSTDPNYFQHNRFVDQTLELHVVPTLATFGEIVSGEASDSGGGYYHGQYVVHYLEDEAETDSITLNAEEDTMWDR
jgi:hypothetical protein